MEGPIIAMATPIISLSANQTSVDVPVKLQGSTTLPVSAHFTLALQQADSSTTQTLDFRLASPQLSWDSGQNQTQNLSVVIAANLDLTTAAIVVRVANASNADVDRAREASLITGMPAEQLTTTFTIQPNQV